MPLFLVDFGAWLSQPSADFAREVSAESAENKEFRARSDYSLLPKCDSPGILFFEELLCKVDVAFVDFEFLAVKVA